MAAIAKDTGTVFVKAPEGVHQAVCVDVITEFGVQKKDKAGKEYTRDEVTLVFQTASINPENNKRYQVRQIFGLNLSQMGKLRPFLQAWRGKQFTKEELKDGFDVEKLLGVNCTLQIIHNGDWANIQSVMPLMPGLEKIAPLDFVRKQDRETVPKPEAEAEVSTALPPVQDVGAVPEEDLPF